MSMSIHEFYMKKVLELAALAAGRTNPNPLVGAIIVKNGSIIAQGHHKVCGGPHAEICALNNANCEVSGGTLYVNLEPCSHFGRTPPCSRVLIESGISEVVIAMEDPNPIVSGKGIQMLRDSGIKVVKGILEDEAKKLNEIFIKYITRKRPFVIMKTAMTLDGKIASVTGDSRWISGKSSRQYVHSIRDRVASIMVGINTVLADNPSLTTRLDFKEGRDPVRIIVDSKGRIPLDSKVIESNSSAGAILATTSLVDPKKEKLLLDRNVKIIKADGPKDQVNLFKLMDELYKLEVDSILLEGGGNLNASALHSGIVDKVMAFIAPKIIGGQTAGTPVEGKGIELMKDAVKLNNITIERFDDDVLIEGYIG